MNEIEFIITPEDMAEVNKRFFQSGNKFAKPYFIFLIIVLLGFFLKETIGMSLTLFITTILPLLVLLGGIHFFSKQYGGTDPQQVLKANEGWDDLIFNTPYIYRIYPDFLEMRSKGTEGKVDWSVFRKSNFDNDFVVLYVGTNFVHVIPRHGVTRGDFDAFTAELQRYLKPAFE